METIILVSEFCLYAQKLSQESCCIGISLQRKKKEESRVLLVCTPGKMILIIATLTFTMTYDTDNSNFNFYYDFKFSVLC